VANASLSSGARLGSVFRAHRFTGLWPISSETGCWIQFAASLARYSGLGVRLQKEMRAWIEATCDHFRVTAADGHDDSHKAAGIHFPVQTELAGMPHRCGLSD
jgi:hypothetical protein